MIIPTDRRGYERVAILNEQAYEAHLPAWGYLRRAAASNYPQPLNLASQAAVSVDSFFGTVNTTDLTALYPPLNQVHLDWAPAEEEALVGLRLSTQTPNFALLQWRFDGGHWLKGRETFISWALHPGENEILVWSVNLAGHAGRPSRLVLWYQPGQANWPENLRVNSFSNGLLQPEPVPFRWEDFLHPRLVALRQKYQLDQVVAGVGSDLERVTRLRDWVKSRWDHQQPISLPPWDAFYILSRVERDIEGFYCAHYSVAFMQCCLSLGIPARLINLHAGIPPEDLDRRQAVFEPVQIPVYEHVVNEVWLDDLGRWVMMDVDFDIHYERDVPLSALEIHQAFLTGELDTLHVCEGPYAYRLKSNDRLYQYGLPPYYAHFVVFWRNNHLSDPDGPTQVVHWTDEKTPPLLWWEGSDLRHRPEIIGPAFAAWPYSQSTPRLNDGNIATCWASAETLAPHWVELRWPTPVTFSQVALDWAECWQRYFTASAYSLQVWQDGAWQDLDQKIGNAETASNLHTFPAVTTERLRLWQPVGGGPAERPNLLWLAEIEVYA